MIKERELEPTNINCCLRKGIHIGMMRIEFIGIDERNRVVEVGIEKANTDIAIDKMYWSYFVKVKMIDNNFMNCFSSYNIITTDIFTNQCIPLFISYIK